MQPFGAARNEVIPLQYYTIALDDMTARLYERVGQAAGYPTEKVLSDALFKLAAELSLEAIHKEQARNSSAN